MYYDKKKGDSEYMISKSVAIEVLNKALSTGADYAEIFEEHSHNQSIKTEKEKVDTSSSTYIDGVGLRLLLND
ncbi:MAG: hypothetical protein LUD22_03820, partial [Coprobacillus sp.]|nr:hypothetical protein [Coprobacillus sp.]